MGRTLTTDELRVEIARQRVDHRETIENWLNESWMPPDCPCYLNVVWRWRRELPDNWIFPEAPEVILLTDDNCSFHRFGGSSVWEVETWYENMLQARLDHLQSFVMKDK
jgi:hypothetical protein